MNFLTIEATLFLAVLNRANDLRQFRIDFVLQEMQDMKLCQLPDDEAWPLEYFTEQAQVLYRRISFEGFIFVWILDFGYCCF